jgi:hypothetical protein
VLVLHGPSSGCKELCYELSATCYYLGYVRHLSSLSLSISPLCGAVLSVYLTCGLLASLTDSLVLGRLCMLQVSLLSLVFTTLFALISISSRIESFLRNAARRILVCSSLLNNNNTPLPSLTRSLAPYLLSPRHKDAHSRMDASACWYYTCQVANIVIYWYAVWYGDTLCRDK